MTPILIEAAVWSDSQAEVEHDEGAVASSRVPLYAYSSSGTYALPPRAQPITRVVPTTTMVNASYLIAVHTCQLRPSGSQAS